MGMTEEDAALSEYGLGFFDQVEYGCVSVGAYIVVLEGEVFISCWRGRGATLRRGLLPHRAHELQIRRCQQRRLPSDGPGWGAVENLVP